MLPPIYPVKTQTDNECVQCSCKGNDKGHLINKAKKHSQPLFNFGRTTYDSCLRCRLQLKTRDDDLNCSSLLRGMICCCRCHDNDKDNCVLAIDSSKAKFCFSCIDNFHYNSRYEYDQGSNNMCCCECHVSKNWLKKLGLHSPKAVAMSCSAIIVVAAVVKQF